jgi:hypothetical protein
MTASRKDGHAGFGHERRRHARIPAEALPHLTARVVGGPMVRLLDVSRRGARVETDLPLRPGRAVTIRFVAIDSTLTLTGAVVRSSVAVLAEDGVKYHTALSFAEDVHLCPETPPAPAGAGVDGRASTPAPSQHVASVDDIGSLTAADDVMVVSAPDDTGDALRERLLANSW